MTEAVSIVKIEPSHVKGKRLCVTLSNGKKYNFGLDGGQTYLDHHDFTKRSNYRTRHYHNPKEKIIREFNPLKLCFKLLFTMGTSYRFVLKYTVFK